MFSSETTDSSLGRLESRPRDPELTFRAPRSLERDRPPNRNPRGRGSQSFVSLVETEAMLSWRAPHSVDKEGQPSADVLYRQHEELHLRWFGGLLQWGCAIRLAISNAPCMHIMMLSHSRPVCVPCVPRVCLARLRTR